MWDIWRRQDTAALRAYLRAHCSEFVHRGQQLSPDSVDDYIHSQVSLLCCGCGRCVNTRMTIPGIDCD